MEIFWLNGNLTLQPETQAERAALQRLIKATTFVNGLPRLRQAKELLVQEQEKVLFAGESNTSVSVAKQVTNGAV